MNLKNAMFAKLYSASELAIAKITGVYPSPHKELDLFIKERIDDKQNKKTS